MRKYCNVADRKDIIEGRLFMEKTKEVKKFEPNIKCRATSKKEKEN